MNILELLRAIFNHRTDPIPPPVQTTCGVAVIVRASDGTGVIPYASVLVGEQVGTTNRDGYVYFGNVPRDARVLVSVAAEGYVSYEAQPYRFLSANQDVPIALETAVPPVPPLPPIPTRDQVCALQTSLQGLTYHTTQYGDIPAWFYALLNNEDRAEARAQHRAAGDSHITVPIAEAYKEPGTLWPEALKAGYDYTQNLDALRAVCLEVIRDGFFVDLPLAGDGLGDGPGYNDPVGNTYGHGWLMANLPRIIAGLKGDGTIERPDLTPYIIFRPGWDAVFYGWGVPGEVPDQQPDRVRRFGELFRSLLPSGYLAIEHTPGNIPCGEGGSDFAPGGLMRNYDTILSEFASVHEDSCWQVVARMVPDYHRPPDQPDGDDPRPPFYLKPGTERGPYFYVAFEPTTGGVYEWCRGRCSLADVNNVRAYLRALGVRYTG